MYRIVICLDVEATSLEDAYRKVYRTMKKVDCKEFQWESTDEWYTPEAASVDEDECQRVRMAVFAEENDQ